MYWLALFVAVISNAIANVAFKKAIMQTTIESGALGLIKLVLEPWMWLGCVFAGLLLYSYLYALKGLDLSIAYPTVTGLAMLAIALAGAMFLGETISNTKVFGIALIITGVVLLKQSA